jgi:hypothetical protein
VWFKFLFADFALYVALPDGSVVTLHQGNVATEARNWSGVKALFE